MSGVLVLGDLIRQYRMNSGMTLSELANQTNVSKGTISKIENYAVKKPEFRTILAIASVLQIPFQTYIEAFIEVEHRATQLNAIMSEAISNSSSIEIISKIATKYLESEQEDSTEAVQQLYSMVSTIEESSIQLTLYKLILEYSRNHGIQTYFARCLMQLYYIERNDFSKLNETYQSGKNILEYAEFLSPKERIVLYYKLGVHAYSLMYFDEAISLMKYIIENDVVDSEFRAHAYFSVANSYYYTGNYEFSQLYLEKYSGYSYCFVSDNVKLMIGCINGKNGDVDLGIVQLQRYLEVATEYNLIFVVSELLELYLQKQDFESAKKLLNYETQMNQSLEDPQTTPFKRANLAYFYKLAGDLMRKEDIEKSFVYYNKSSLEYIKISHYSNSLESQSQINEVIIEAWNNSTRNRQFQ